MTTFGETEVGKRLSPFISPPLLFLPLPPFLLLLEYVYRRISEGQF